MNLKKPSDAYVPGGRLSSNDILVSGIVPRNRAIDGDLVVVQLLPRHEWAVLEQDIEENNVLSTILLGPDAKTSPDASIPLIDEDDDDDESPLEEGS